MLFQKTIDIFLCCSKKLWHFWASRFRDI